MPREPDTSAIPPLRNVVAMLQVGSVSRASAFYALLGFEVANAHQEPGCDEPAWAWLQSQHGGSVMLAQAGERTTPVEQAILLYLYCDDVAAMHAALLASGVAVGDIAYPFYCPKGEFRVVDPDGHVAMVTHT